MPKKEWPLHVEHLYHLLVHQLLRRVELVVAAREAELLTGADVGHLGLVVKCGTLNVGVVVSAAFSTLQRDLSIVLVAQVILVQGHKHLLGDG